jgi:hypothetical protein
MTVGCVFCGSRPLTKEHLWPDWLRRKVKINDAFRYRLENEIDGVEIRDHAFLAQPFTQTVKAVCARCNGGWMSAIEASAQPILWNLIQGQGMTLDPDDQRKLASWAFLKACMFDQLHPRPGLPTAHRQRLHVYKKPPATGVAIWIGTYEARDVCHQADQALAVARRGDHAPQAPNTYISTFTVGALMLQVAGSLIPELAPDRMPYPPELCLTKIWPARDDNVEFAQDRVMSHETMVGFTKVLYNALGRLAGGAPPAR